MQSTAVRQNGSRAPAEFVGSTCDLQAFAYTVAHDLREPLRTIAAFTEVFVRRGQFDEEQRELARFIVEGVKRMSGLLEDLLASATRGAHDSLQPVQLEHTVTQAAQNLRVAIAASGATITTEQLPVVYAPGIRIDTAVPEPDQ